MASSGRVFLLAFAVLISASAATQKSYVIISKLPFSSILDLITSITKDFKVLYDMSAIRGIAVQIDDGWAATLKNQPGVLAVIPDRIYQLQTTHSWEFLGLESRAGTPSAVWQSDAKFGEGTIIGNVDTGVWPTSESFKDYGLGKPFGWKGICDGGNDPTFLATSVWPTSESFKDDGLDKPFGWKGICDGGNDPTFRCNNKLIGARYFSMGIRASSSLFGGQPPSEADTSSPLDYVGHGSHTLSTAGGGLVPDAGVLGHGSGTAKGGSPRARVASYKACYAPGCSGVDILAAMLAAVADDVHVLSLSLGADPSDYATDLIAIGAFFAVQNRVTVVCSAGNSGPKPSSATNLAPWILTVGASTMDRDFPAFVAFNGITIKGQSLSDSTLPVGQQYPVISGDKANAASQPPENSTLCLPGSLDPAKVRGKIVVCIRGNNARVEKGLNVKQAGGVGMVLCNDASTGDDVIADPHLIAAAHCSYDDCKRLFTYLSSPENPVPVGSITAKDAELDVKPAPVMAAFSSRGPNIISPQILKPDITAPGVSVIAAYSGAVSPTELPFDDRRVPYNIMSGTSMSCPHVSGIAALIRTRYPGWSPAMIKSAIMTTATTGANDGVQIRDETGGAATPFSYGSGHVNPVRALDPGLVYDTTPADYANFLCSMRPSNPQSALPISLPLQLPLFVVGNDPFGCSKGTPGPGRPEDLNHPSITVVCLSGATTVKRRVKNVGAAPSTYTAAVTQPAGGVRITVEPIMLRFGAIDEEKEFAVKLEVVDALAAANYVFGGIEWKDGKHRVWSPVVATTLCK